MDLRRSRLNSERAIFKDPRELDVETYVLFSCVGTLVGYPDPLAHSTCAYQLIQPIDSLIPLNILCRKTLRKPQYDLQDFYLNCWFGAGWCAFRRVPLDA